MTGCNVDPLCENNAPNLAHLAASGFDWVRLVSRPGVENYVAMVRNAGIMVLAVVTEESHGMMCEADAYQIGNEPDASGSGPNIMNPGQFVQYWDLYRGTYFSQGGPLEGKILIGPGLCSGQPSYWHQIQEQGGLAGAKGYALHPYGKNAEETKILIAAYHMVTPHLPLWITEWNRPTAEIPEYQLMTRVNSVRDAWFCWDYTDASGNVWSLSQDAGRDINA